MTTKITKENPKNLLERTIAYSLTLRGIGTSRKVPTDAVQTDAQPDRIRISKRILEGDEMKGIRKLDLGLRVFLHTRSVPYPLKAGIYLIPVDLLEEVDAEVERVRPLRDALVRKLADRIDELRELDREALASLFDEEDYPSAERICAEYGIETRYITLDLPGNLRAVSRAVFDREAKRMRSELESAGEAVRQIQRAQLKGLVDGLVARLTPKDGGRKRVLRSGGPLDQMAEFLGRWGQLNVTEDGELAKIVSQAKSILKGVDVEALRKEETLVIGVKQGMEKIQAALEPLIQDAPRRRFFSN